MAFATTNQLDWNVVSRDMTYQVDGVEYKVPGKKVQVRDDNYEVVGVVGNGYHTYQNSDFKNLIAPAVSEGVLTIENIGYLGRGEKVFCQAVMAEEFKVVGETHKGMISLMNSHDGTSALAGGVTDVRVICGNTFAQAMTDMGTKIRHGKNLYIDAENIKVIVDYVNEGMAKFSQAAEILATTRCNDEMVDKVITSVYGKKEVSQVRAANDIKKFFRDGIGTEGKSCWDLMNGFTQFYTHESGKDDNKRYVSSNFGRNAVLSRKAMNIMMAMA